MKKEEIPNKDLSQNYQWNTIYLGYLLFGGIILFVGLQYALRKYMGYTFPLHIDFVSPEAEREYWLVQRWRIYWGLALATGGGGLVGLPHLGWKEMEKGPRDERFHPRRWQALHLGYLLLGGIILSMGLIYMQIHLEIFIEAYYIDLINFIFFWRELSKGFALFAIGGGLGALPYFVRRAEGNINNRELYLQRLWQVLRSGYLLLGGAILLVGLQYALYYIENYQACLSSECRNIYRGDIYKSLVKTGMGGSLMPLSYFVLGRIQDRTQQNRRKFGDNGSKESPG